MGPRQVLHFEPTTKQIMTVRNIPFGRPIIGEQEQQAVREVLSGHMLVHGPKAKEFERDFAQFTNAPNAVSVASCTAALHLAYFVRGIGPGDEVLVPAQTHVATAHAVELVGATPVFVDAEAETGNIDLNLLEDLVTERTRAISLVHYLGMPVDMQRLMSFAQTYGLYVVEDCALALGSYFQGEHAGLHGDIGCFSFYPVKHMTTAEGGMVICKSAELAEKIARQKAFGLDRTVTERQVPGIYDVNMLGFNYRLNELAAALGIEQLKRLPEFLSAREQNYKYLEEKLRGIEGIRLFQSSHGEFKSSYYCLSVLLEEQIASRRFELVSVLKEKGVGTSVYYPQAVPCFSYYREKYGYHPEDFPVAHSISQSTIAFPVGPHLNLEDMEYIAVQLASGIRQILN